MGRSKISIIIAREFAVRVKKKSFILTTILTPLLLAAMMIVPSVIAMYSSGEEGLKIDVVDNSGIVMPYLTSDEQAIFTEVKDKTIDELKRDFNNLDVYAIVGISALDSSKNVSVTAYSKKQMSMDMQRKIKRGVKDAVEDNKLKGYDIPNLDEVIADLNADVKLSTFKIDDSGDEKASMVEVYMSIGYIASFMIYMFIFMFGSMVMRSVIEEKTTRIIEVIVSSVKPFQLMMGKILGVASVALTQFLIWIVLTVTIVTVASSVFGFDLVKDKVAEPMQVSQQISGVSPDSAAGIADSSVVAAVQADPEVGGFLQALANIDYMSIIAAFVIYFVLGYLLYSSMFAAVGAAVDNEADTQQLILPVTMPLIIGLFIMLHTFQYPDSALSFWGSMIPFTSPMVMMARIAYGVPAWELALSIGLLVLTFIALAYVSAKVYRVGILMYGKKASWKDIIKWLKY